MNSSRLKQHALAVTLAGLALTSLPAGAESAAGDQWAFTVTPYLWLPNINGTLKFQLPNLNAGTSVETGPNDYLENLDFVLMISGEARKGKWSVFTDVIYLDFSDEVSRVDTVNGVPVPPSIDLGTQASLTGGVWTLVGGYAAVQEPKATLDVIGGFRYLDIEASADWMLSGPLGLLPPTGSVSEGKGLWDAVVGVRGQVKLGDGNWFAPYYVDVGTGQSDLTWQAMGGVGYRFAWGELIGAYRHLDYRFGEDTGMKALSFSGPAVSLGFRW